MGNAYNVKVDASFLGLTKIPRLRKRARSSKKQKGADDDQDGHKKGSKSKKPRKNSIKKKF